MAVLLSWLADFLTLACKNSLRLAKKDYFLSQTRPRPIRFFYSPMHTFAPPWVFLHRVQTGMKKTLELPRQLMTFAP
jgi:hypothetical protein